jgi:hypothetical protein
VFLFALLATTSLACGQVVIWIAPRSFLAKIILLLTCATHVPVEIVVPHSVIRHIIYPPICSMVNGSTGVDNDQFLRPVLIASVKHSTRVPITDGEYCSTGGDLSA